MDSQLGQSLVWLPPLYDSSRSRLRNWHANYSFDPILEGSTDQFLKVEGRLCGEIMQLTSEMARPGPNGQLTLTPEVREPWISSTSSLSKYFGQEFQEIITARDAIWKTLTMGLLHSKMNQEEAALCFSKLWTPEGRGAVQNYALIEWIDRNAWFEYSLWNLRGWSQVRPTWGRGSISSGDQQQSQGNGSTALEKGKSKGKSNVVQKLDIFIKTIEKVLGSGMRFAVLKSPEHEELAMVPPGTRKNDEVWMIRGCSVPIVLRRQETCDPYTPTYKVIGGVYFDDTLVYAKDLFGFQEIRMKASRGDWDEEQTTEMIYLC
jgi:hypothetical protein